MSVIDLLRKETGCYHDLLDKHSELSKITSDSVTVRDYYNYLILFYGIHKLVESEVEKHIDSNFPFHGRLSLLRGDMEKCNVKPEVLDKFSFELDPQNVIGAYYVLEGSKLGGKYIASHLLKHLSLGDERFTFLVKKSNYSWKNVVDKLEQLEPSMHSNTVDGAIETFKFILSYVEQFYEFKHK